MIVGLILLTINLVIVLKALVLPGFVETGPNQIVGNKYGYVTVNPNLIRYGGRINYPNGTLYFNLTGYEFQLGLYQFIVQSYGNGTFDLRFQGVAPVTVIAPGATSSSYVTSKKWQELTYASNINTPLTLIYSVSINTSEPKSVLFLDDFIHSNPLLSSSWTIDNYAASGTIPGEYTSAGFAAMVAQSSSSVETIHVSTPIAYSPSAYSNNQIVKRKLTASLFPFQKSEPGNTAAILVGMTPLLTSGAFPGTAPANTPFVDLGINCVSPGGASNSIGTSYMQMYNSGAVIVDTCGDGGFNRVTLTNLDPTLYTVFTVETSGIFCSTCVDNTFSGSSWVWFRVYQNDKSGSIISSTDKNINFTSNIAPLFQTTYVFASLQNNNAAATHQTSYIDLVQLQNYGSPVCLFGCLPPIFEHGNLPPVLSSIWAALVNAADVLGQGDIGFGSMLLFGLFTLVPIVTFAATRSTMLASAEFLAVLGIMMASGLFGSIWIFAVIIATAYLGWGIIKKMFLGGGGMGSMGGEA